MKFQKWARVSLWFLLVIVISGCSLSSTNVETVVAEQDIRYWGLSPDGYGLIYGGARNKDNYLIDLSSGEKQEIDCSLRWLNDEMLLCSRYNHEIGLQITTLDRDVFIESGPFNEVDINTLSDADLNNLLENAKDIYRRPEGYIYLFGSDNENYVIVGVGNIEGVPGNYTYKSFSERQPYCPQKALDEGSISPDGTYYYTTMRQSKSVLSIFSTNDNEKVVSFTTGEAEFIECGGWAGDSSGVFFRVHGVAFHAPTVPAEIKKLKVPVK